MPNLMQAMKEEISRLARKEIRTMTSSMKKDTVRLKKENAELKRRVNSLEKTNRRLLAAEKRRIERGPVVPKKELSKARIGSRTIRAMRRKMGLSQADFAKVVGVAPMSVYHWEKAGGPLKLREDTRAKIVAARAIGAREAKARLKDLASKSSAPTGRAKK